jgi:hypothetical protein
MAMVAHSISLLLCSDQHRWSLWKRRVCARGGELVVLVVRLCDFDVAYFRPGMRDFFSGVCVSFVM